MSDASEYEQRYLRDDELRWWVRFGARVEARQSLGNELREVLITHLRAAARGWDGWEEQAFEAALNYASDESMDWIDPCVRFGLFDEAWTQQQRAELLVAFSPASPVQVDHLAFAEYALWLLGLHERDAPANVGSMTRAFLHEVLGMRSAADPAIWQRVLKVVEDKEHPDRKDGIGALKAAARAGVAEALGILLEIAVDPEDRGRVSAFEALGSLAADGSTAAIERLGAIAQDKQDRDRERALKALIWASARGQATVSQFLLPIADDADDPLRGEAVRQLKFFAAQGDTATISLLEAMAKSPTDRGRNEAIEGLRWAAARNHSAATEALRRIFAEPLEDD